ncbi:MAG: translocation/assembly module TamB domain-containing protein, partial [Gemmatimonadota bacterium]
PLLLGPLSACDALGPVLEPPGLPAPPPAPPPIELDAPPGPAAFRIVATEVRGRTREAVNPAIPPGVEAGTARVEAVVVVPGVGGRAGGRGAGVDAGDGDADGADAGGVEGARGDAGREDAARRDAVDGEVGGVTLRVPSLRLVRPRVIFPPDTVVTGLDVFFPLFAPRIVVDRLVIDDGDFGMLAAAGQAPGRWFWRLAGVDALFEDVWLGGEVGRTERFDLVRLAGAGELRGRPLLLEHLAGSAVRTPTRLTFDADADLGLSRLELDGRVQRTGEWSLAVDADTLRFAELRAVVRSLPERGTGEARLRLDGRVGGPTRYAIERFRGSLGRSLVSLRGTITAAATPALDDVVLEMAPLFAADLEAATGVVLPLGDGSLRGVVRGDGDARTGIAVRGRALHTQPGGGVSRLALGGVVRLRPSAFVDLNLSADPLTAGGRAFDLSLNARGPPDSLTVVGTALTREPRPVLARLDAVVVDEPDTPPRLTGTALLRARLEPAPVADARAPPDPELAPPIRARAVGSVVLAREGAVDVRVTAEAMPLALLPFPAEVERVTGFVAGSAAVGGTVADPAVRGRFRVVDGGLEVREYGVVVRRLQGPLLLRADVLDVRLRGVAGAEGTEAVGAAAVDDAGAADVPRVEDGLALGGRVTSLFDSPRLDLRLELDSARVVDRDSARAVVSGVVALTGPAGAPRFDGRLVLIEGYAFEDFFMRDGALDVDDPPYADLARRAPWPARSRLLRAEPEDGFPVTGELEVRVTPGFEVIDEDSELFGAGAVRFVVERDGVSAEGTIRVRGGFYAFFGERFEVAGGVLDFPDDGRESRVGLIAVHEAPTELGGGRGAPGGVVERFPPLEFFAHGPVSRPAEELRRPSLFPESREELAELLLYGLPPVPVTGWRQPVVWRATELQEVVGERAEAQAVPLFWSYVADEAYDILPLASGRIEVGTVRVGPRYPAELAIGAVIGVAATPRPGLELIVSQPLAGTTAPGLRARLDVTERLGLRGRGFVEAFVAPRYFADPIGGEAFPGFVIDRRVGVGAGWAWEW